MASDINNLNSKEKLRWGKVYTRRTRKIQKKDGNDDVSNPISQTLGAEKAVQPEERRVQHQQDEAAPQKQDLLTSGNVPGGEGYTGEVVPEGGSGTRPNSGGGSPRGNAEVANNRFVRPVISRVDEDRVRISLTGTRPGDEIRNFRRTLEIELHHVRSFVKKLEAKELELTSLNSGDNDGVIMSRRYPQYIDSDNVINSRSLTRGNSEIGSVFRPPSLAISDNVINSRSLMRVNSEIGSVGMHIQPRPFRPPSLAGSDNVISSRSLMRVNSEVGSGGPHIQPRPFCPPSLAVSDNVMNSRLLMRVNSDVGSVGRHIQIQPRQFRPPGLSVVVNNHAVGDFVEREKRTPKANPYYKNSEFLLGKDRLPSESNKKLKTHGSGKKHVEKYRKQLFRSCGDLLQRLMKHKHGWVFNEPVNVKALGLHDYHDIIKHPMDLGTIKTRLSQNWYKSLEEFAEDIRLVFSNAMTYNPKGQDVHVMAEELSQIFEERWAVIEAKYNPGPTSRKFHHHLPFVHEPYHALTHASQARTLERSESTKKPSKYSHVGRPPKYSRVGRPPVPKKPKAKDPNKREMTFEEKQKLSANLENLPPEKLEAIVQIIKKRSSAVNQINEEIEVDIDSVDVETLWELDRFATNYKKSLSKYKRKAELDLQATASATRSAPITSSGPMVADGLKESRTGEMHTSDPSTNVEGGRQADNASSSSSSTSSTSDSGSSSSDSDSDSSSTNGSDAGH
ncbi:transcription factor GTE4-like [Lycium ferocissimum]|uniref:transcription factor GTE4-like n=1 Tax=Lycium ferocissimum TaxID=112874 RepID=UPI002815616B|nr:transcription factor GTE4-like [Lycium ferocissimum]